jgi:hypothetical protein
MKFITKKITLIFLIISLFVSFNSVQAQDLSYFEIMDNNSVGLTVAPFAKRGECLVDIDRNGWADVYTLKYSNNGYSRIYTNNEGFFTDITHQTPIEQIESAAGVRSFTVVWADYDNDGDKDCSFGTNEAIYLLRNDNNFLTDVSEEMGFVGYGNPGFFSDYHYTIAGWADYDLDGDLDCLIYQLNYTNLYLFRNDGDHFTDVASEAGLDSTVLSIDNFMNVMVWTDWDMDGDPDISSRHEFFVNENGVFRDVKEELGFADISWTNHKEFFDYDNDGDLDYYKVTGRAAEGDNELWENRDGFYVDVSADAGLNVVSDRFRGVSTGDFDNDGDQDIFMQLNMVESMDVLLVNDVVAPGVRAFSNVAQFIGLTKMGDRIGGGFFDYNNDGFLDIYIPSVDYSHILYRNAAVNGGNWIGFILEGTISNRDAIGSFIWLYYKGGEKQLRYTKAGSGWIRQDNPWVHFGIGFETAIDSIVIRWPLGYKEVLTGFEINQYHNLNEPDYTSVEFKKENNTIAKNFRLEQNYPNPFNPDTRINYHLSEATHVFLSVYDMKGRLVTNLINNKQTSGQHSAVWNGRDSKNSIVSSGVYLYRLKADKYIESRKMIFIQ